MILTLQFYNLCFYFISQLVKISIEMATKKINFSENDLNLLLSIIETHKNVIECKKSDTFTVDAKNKAWFKIQEEYNSRTSSSFRDEKMLRTKYYNMKKELKKKVAAEKRSCIATGGGPPLKISTNDIDVMLTSIIGSEQLEGMESVYDSDNPFVRNKTEDVIVSIDKAANNISAMQSQDGSEEFEDIMNTSNTATTSKNWSTYTPADLKAPKSKKLIIDESQRKEKNTSTSWSKLAAVKSKWTGEKCRVEIEILKAEHEKRVKMYEQHIKQSEVEHKMRMRIMEEQLKEIQRRNLVYTNVNQL
ncbi:myb/SANT-like DNA-binding domain-containing protein 3 [Bactrocera neohumeralis]|uniref:myb/SANT-like DNA-binding domain-containing protein 3 n=1 Tax=Bactrocera neohumeralis TaxID=98809 RepID=UPI002166924D|nr:myb/SANT-like DNA-binding domain-containing protein 3 [Bactrocera neohumeralis]